MLSLDIHVVGLVFLPLSEHLWGNGMSTLLTGKQLILTLWLVLHILVPFELLEALVSIFLRQILNMREQFSVHLRLVLNKVVGKRIDIIRRVFTDYIRRCINIALSVRLIRLLLIEPVSDDLLMTDHSAELLLLVPD